MEVTRTEKKNTETDLPGKTCLKRAPERAKTIPKMVEEGRK